MLAAGSAYAANTIDNLMAGFDITATNQVYGAAFTADTANVNYTMKFEYELVAGTWTELGSKTVYVTATGALSLDVQMGTLGIGTDYPGRVRLLRGSSVVATKTGTFRGPPPPPGL